ncbi:MAG: S8 family serine peptidase, partial [Pirellulaceae bacterium]
GLLATEKMVGDGTWVDPALAVRFRQMKRVKVSIWFEEQLLGDGQAYSRRAGEFAGRKRSELRTAAIETLKAIHARSWKKAQPHIKKLVKQRAISAVEPFWIVNGFSCAIAEDQLESLKLIPGVKMIFARPQRGVNRPPAAARPPSFAAEDRQAFDPGRYKHPWYIRSLQADRVWREFQVAGQGTLNVFHDFNFVFSDNLTGNLYRNPGEIPANGKDDDRNGLIDDYHGFNFDAKTAVLTQTEAPADTFSPQLMHGFMCAAIVCGRGVPGKPYEFGIAPEARWSGVIGSSRLEQTVQWAAEQGADTYSMSFSVPGLGEYRSHWRKIMEQGSLCGIFFVSGAGNFAQSAQLPVQMRVPEDIPDVVFAAAGVQRNFQRTPFSSQGPVEWATEHYQDGTVQKPEVCAFNMGLPALLRNGEVRPVGLNGNSFAGPMFCGAISLMLSADPDLLPWDLKEIITSTATDVAAEGVDYQTGHGLINCYRAVREVLRRRAIREGTDPAPYSGREAGDEIDVSAIQKQLAKRQIVIARVVAGSQAEKLGLKVNDVVLRISDQPITAPDQIRKAIAKAVQDKVEKLSLVVQRE